MMRRALCPLLLLSLAGLPCLADEPPSFPLTTDTLQYCNQLARQVADHHSVQPDVQRLLTEGREMCERGQIRGGIRRMRRALLMLRHKIIRDDQ
jgi:hypothetical protein